MLVAVFAMQVTAQARPATTTCELADGYLNLAMSEASRDTVLIVIAHLGKTEYKQDLNRRRLYNVKMYLTKFNDDSFYAKNPENIIYAVGKQTEGLGVVELFSKGRLLEKLFVPNNRDLYIGECSVDLELYKLPCDMPDQKIFYPCLSNTRSPVRK